MSPLQFARRIIAFFLICEEITANPLVLPEHTLEVLNLHRNNVMSQFISNEHAHETISNHLGKIMNEDSPKFHQQHNFILTVDQSLENTLTSIEKLKNFVGGNNFFVFYKNHLHVSMKPAQLKEFMENNKEYILNVTPLIPVMKMSEDIHSISLNCGTPETIKKFMIRITALSEEELNHFRIWLDGLSQLKDLKFSYTRHELAPHMMTSFRVFTNCASYALVAKYLSEQTEILYVEDYKDVRTWNYWARGVLESGDYGNDPIERTLKLTGAGQVIGIADTGLDLNSNYFYDNVTITANAIAPNILHRKVVSYRYISGGSTGGDFSDIEQGHGSHVAGTAAGKAFEDYGDYKRFDGVASDAKIAFFDISRNDTEQLGVPTPLDTACFLPLYNDSAYIISNSWGNTDSSYSGYSQLVDEFMWTHKDALVLFANGNTGDHVLTPSSPVSGLSTVGSPANCKNCVSVGAGLSDHQSWTAFTKGSPLGDQGANTLAAFSSRGPTTGSSPRIKPDILGPGFFVYSVSAHTSSYGKYHTGITYKAGTSMATPAVAGIAAIIRQYFVDGWYNNPANTVPVKATTGFTPSGALMKAMLIASGSKSVTKVFESVQNSISALTSGYPSNDVGYGRVQINNILHFAAASTSPLTLSVMGDVNAGPRYAEFTGTGTPQTYTFTLTSTQDVRVVLCYTDYSAGSTSPVIQNVLSLSVTGGTPYTLSGITYSVVDIAAAAPGNYTVTVSCTTLSNGPQPYALVMLASGSIVKPAATTDEYSTVVQSTLSLASIPYLGGIVIMSIVAFILCSVTTGVFVAESMAERSYYFKYHRW